MRRKEFIWKSIVTSISGTIFSNFLKLKGSKQKEYSFLNKNTDKLKNTNMNVIIHKADTRGYADHGWLKSYHSFSFADYYNSERMKFGVLRVLNDDTVQAGEGFGTHPHEDMEIISIPLEGDLEHKDSMGNVAVIKEGDVQVMSAGKGVYHSEYNKNDNKDVKFLQIWIYPNKKGVNPRYDQISIRDIEIKNKFYQILSPNAEDKGVWIYQDAWFSLGKFDKGASDLYELNDRSNGVYLFLIEGTIDVNGYKLSRRDGIGIQNVDKIEVNALDNANILLMEIPMSI